MEMGVRKVCFQIESLPFLTGELEDMLLQLTQSFGQIKQNHRCSEKKYILRLSRGTRSQINNKAEKMLQLKLLKNYHSLKISLQKQLRKGTILYNSAHIRDEELIFSKVAILQPTVLQKVISNIGNFPCICKTWYNNYFTRTPFNTCFLIILSYCWDIFSRSNQLDQERIFFTNLVNIATTSYS